MPTYRTAANTYAIQQVGYGSTGAHNNTAGWVNGEWFGYPHVPRLLETARRRPAFPFPDPQHRQQLVDEDLSPSVFPLFIGLDADFTDEFDHAPNFIDLDSPWHESEEAVVAVRALSGQLELGNGSRAGLAYWDADYAADHFAELREPASGGQSESQVSGPAVRVSFGATWDNFTGYLMLTDGITGGGPTITYRLYRLSGFNLTAALPAPLASVSIPVDRWGFVHRLQIVGSVLSVFDEFNGELLTVTDPTPLTGSRLGVATRRPNFISDLWESFRGGAVASGGGIWTAERWGTPTVSIPLLVSPTGIPSAEAWGAPRLDLNVRPSGIPTAEAWGSPRLNLNVLAQAIATAEAWGLATLTGGGPPAPPAGKPGGRPQYAVGDRAPGETGAQTRWAVGGRGRDIYPRRGT